MASSAKRRVVLGEVVILAGVDVVLSDEVLDRIDEVVPAGADAGALDQDYQPPALQSAGVVRPSALRPCVVRLGHRIDTTEEGRSMELWQMVVMGRAFLADGREMKIVTGIDDHSRFCVYAVVVARATARPVCVVLVAALRRHGMPEQVLTDNGKVFTARFGLGPGPVLSDTRALAAHRTLDPHAKQRPDAGEACSGCPRRIRRRQPATAQNGRRQQLPKATE